MGLVPLWTAAMTVFDPLGSIKWWIVLLLLLFALALALPDEQTDRQLGRALRRMPVLFLLTAANLFRPVSYTHLDVYKRQSTNSATRPPTSPISGSSIRGRAGASCSSPRGN